MTTISNRLFATPSQFLTEDFQSGMDSLQEDETNLEEMRNENKTHQTVRVSENACVAATASGVLASSRRERMPPRCHPRNAPQSGRHGMTVENSIAISPLPGTSGVLGCL